MSRGAAADKAQFHAAECFSDRGALSPLIGDFLATGFAQGDAGVIIAIPEHSAAIETDLRRRGVDVDDLKKMGELVVLDARETLNTFMVDGLPHTATFNYVLGRVLDQVCRAHPHCPIRVYSEMVNMLSKDRLDVAADQLDTLWDGLARTRTRDFHLLCG